MLSGKTRATCHLLAAFLTFLLAPPTQAYDASLIHQREIKSASELDYPPFAVVKKDGSADGFSVELLKAVIREAGLTIHFRVGPWNEIKQDLAQGRLDVLPLVSYSQEREAVFDFTAPYLQMHGTIFVRKGEKSIRRKPDLKDKEVLVMRGDTAHEYAVAEKLTHKLILTDSFAKAMELLSSGKHDAVVVQQLVGLQLIKQLNISNVVDVNTLLDKSLKPKGRPLSGFEQKFCFAVKEENKVLLAHLNEGLAIVNANGTYDKLYDKWFGPIFPPPPIPLVLILKYALFIIGPALLFMSLVGILYLRRKVERKTATLAEELKQRRRADSRRQALIEISRRFLKKDPAIDPYPEVAEILRSRMEYPSTSVELYDEDNGEMIFVGSAGISVPDMKHLRVPVTQTISGMVATTGQAIIELNASRHKSYRYKMLQDLKTETFVCVPLKGERRILGTLALGDTVKRVSVEKDMEALEIIANQIALEMERRQTEEKLVHNEYLLEESQKIANVGSYSLDINTNQVDWSIQNYRMFGYEPGEVKPSFDIVLSHVHPDDRDKFIRSNRNSIEKGLDYDETYRIIRNDGTERIVHSKAKMAFDASGKPYRSYGALQDITEHKQAEEALTESEKALSIKNEISNIFLTVPDDEMYGDVLNVVLKAVESPYGTFAYIDHNGARVVPSMTGDIWEECKIPGKGIYFPRDTWEGTLWGKCLMEKKSVASNGPFTFPDGHMHIARALATPILHKGKSIGNFMVGDKPSDYSKDDIHRLEAIANYVAPMLHARLMKERYEIDRQKAEETIQRVQEFYKSVLEGIIDGVWVSDKDDVISYANRGMGVIAGVSPDQIVGSRLFEDFSEDLLKYFSPLYQKARETLQTLSYDSIPVVTPAGRQSYQSGWLIPKIEEGKFDGMIVTVEDVTEKKQIERRLRKSLQEKEVLIKEIHHRVKNNLQVVGTLLRLQSETVGEKRYADLFKTSSDRIRSIALVHEMLYQSKDYAAVNLKRYLEMLSSSLLRSHDIDYNRIRLDLDSLDIEISMTTAIPCGLIANELITNALEHAFPNGEKGRIILKLGLTGVDEIELIISDNGIGVPDDIDLMTTRSMGLYLVRILAQDQLHGSIEMDRTKGTRFTIRFSPDKTAKKGQSAWQKKPF